jgi:hypothetical protein
VATLGYNDLIPDDLQFRLMHMAASLEDNEWEIGRYAVELCDEWETHKVPKTRVCEAMALFCRCKPGTIRDYEYTSRNVPTTIRSAYPELGRCHFRELIPRVSEPEDWGRLIDDWKKTAKTLSVRSLQAFLARKDGAPPAWEGRLARVREACDALADDQEAPERVQRAARAFLAATA